MNFTTRSPTNETLSSTVAVIGAGLAGVNAARELQARGWDVTVFEKSRGVGGRMSVRRREPYAFDHGAQYFTARDECFAAYVEGALARGVAAEWRGRIVSLEDEKIRPSTSQTRYVAVPGMNALVKDLAADLNIITETRVRRLDRRDGVWQLYGDEGRLLGPYESLVLALPAEQVAELLPHGHSFVESVRQCVLLPCWAVMLGFEKPLEIDYDAAFVHDSPLSWIARNNSKPGRPTNESWVLHAGPDWSQSHLERDPSEIPPLLLDAFRRLPGVPALGPVYAEAHRWRYALPESPLEAGCLHDAERSLVVAGDWCRKARVEGAYLSGRDAAQRLLDTRTPFSCG